MSVLCSSMYHRRLCTLLCRQVPVSCDSYDTLFDVSIPDRIQPGGKREDLFATAHRCMHDVCWFKPARAYVLALFVDNAAMNRLKCRTEETDEIFTVDFPKSFLLFFASNKDSTHIRNGFDRSFRSYVKGREIVCTRSTGKQCHCDECKMAEFLQVLDGHFDLKKNDFIRISIKNNKNISVSFNDESDILIHNAESLVNWIHWLYVGLPPDENARYKSIQQKLRLPA